ncbi:MAG: RNA 2',3'-cyclic phosphodiesterase [Methanobrevibacter sp.]|jgi:2'-5' RNA ligase|nr:RNA 2',3'-cyclic phosphodiesterase [Candidatus Methanovirga basalitermitum]
MEDDSKLRTFLAIDIDENLIANILDIQREFKSTKADVKYVSKENLHLTLKFFGDVDESMLSKISKVVKETLLGFKPIKLDFSGLGAFPSDNHVNVIWIGVFENNELLNLVNRLNKGFNGLGFKEEKNFKSHLTIGRMRNSRNKNEVKDIIHNFKGFEVGVMEVFKLSLKKSDLTPAGPVYSDLEIFEFNLKK